MPLAYSAVGPDAGWQKLVGRIGTVLLVTGLATRSQYGRASLPRAVAVLTRTRASTITPACALPNCTA